MSERAPGGGEQFGVLGMLTAGFLSFKTWGATWWLLLHIFFGWSYVAYWVVFWSGWIR